MKFSSGIIGKSEETIKVSRLCDGDMFIFEDNIYIKLEEGYDFVKTYDLNNQSTGYIDPDYNVIPVKSARLEVVI